MEQEEWAGGNEGRNWSSDALIKNEEVEEDRGCRKSDVRRVEAEGVSTRDSAEEFGDLEVESIECVLADWVCVCGLGMCTWGLP